ncbi:MATE family efflux transporter [Pseudomonas sp. CH235]|jgi:MATE family multidrug resistance protein|uniref:MATE family efflux transporter n=1 Tax=Pseudomonas sp. CH235 TaxID=1634006 RepID=UPI001062FAED|nr:MATE family efflux transporter [Pseudomonas sp. CH235]TEA62542.1 MATE family efflux transporter [Pseudomonas sp. CH235]
MSQTIRPPGHLHEIRATAWLSLPLVIGHLCAGLIAFVDNLIAGNHGTDTLAAVTLGTALLWLPMLVPIGTLIALTASVARLHGAERTDEIGPIFRQAMWLALFMGGLMFAFLSLVPHLLAPAGIAPEIIPGAQAFLQAVRWGSPALTLFFCMRYLCEGMHWMRPTMVFGFGGLLFLAPVGYVLTNGKLGFVEMGAEGLGIASALMMWLQALLFAAHLWRGKRLAHLQLFARFDPPRLAGIVDLLRVGIPIGIAILTQGSLFIVTSLLIGRLGSTFLSAHQIAVNLAQLCFMIPVAVAEATTVRVGHALGRGDFKGVRQAAGAGCVIVLVAQSVSVLIMLLGNETIAGWYSADVAVTALASTLLLYAAALQFPDGLQMLSAGALRGLQDTRVPMWLAIFCYWGVGLPLGCLMAFGLGWGPQGIWLGLITALTLAMLLMGRRFFVCSRMGVAVVD